MIAFVMRMPSPKRKTILASASPRRKEILQRLGWDFEIIPCQAEEPAVKIPAEIIKSAEFKAKNVLEQILNNSQASEHQQENPETELLIIAADTVVCLGTEIMGKPKDKIEAISMLKSLSGKSHTVSTAISLIKVVPKQEPQIQNHLENTSIQFRTLSDIEIENYVDSGEPMDKAGAYAIQAGASVFVSKINGCYNNVVGLPVAALLKLLADL